jgi:hypothetical protein
MVEGAPSVVQGDNGKEFKNKLLRNLYSKYNAISGFGRSRYPQTQGIVETKIVGTRRNQTLGRRLSKSLHGKGVRWIVILS